MELALPGLVGEPRKVMGVVVKPKLI